MKGLQKQSVVIVAGGVGLRAGTELPKQFVSVGGKPLLMHTIQVFYRYNREMKIVVVLHPEYRKLWAQLCSSHGFEVPHLLVDGGATRFHSVKNGLSLIDDDEMVAIHDAARPFVAHSVIENVFAEAANCQCGAIPVVSEKNSVRMLTSHGHKPIDRSLLKLVQTPQVFPARLLKKAYSVDFKSSFTDDASVAEEYGIEIHLVEGNDENIKITTAFDFNVAEILVNSILQ
ncbi:MAG: 2-C-methyl-D-erythritol 4-phosphate cytidylyltransferase [Bacteroidota bacterium]|jgi:2-C-methyl-D-erythritol 4-phosphate cytidylyltransferase|nr:2-C-methyl-D-erythritol 4-phosphate cytidylyltransferase [Bacteroidota bacterium]PLB86609.1 2-C-methyl-D-erythritol 4-phosphate cytidylyltransferase [Dysgonamonadaceae bacterium]